MSAALPGIVNRKCNDCGNEMAVTRSKCPHCGRPSYFPNVDIAKSSNEKKKLERRFEDVRGKIEAEGRMSIAEEFLVACQSTKAAFACSLQKLSRQVGSSSDIFESYYHIEDLRSKASTPKSLDWSKLRPQAEIELLGSHRHITQAEEIHYACLTIDGKGPDNYGECVVQLSEPMIAHRTSCFEGNTAVLYDKHHDFSNFLRSAWDDRSKICFAVFASHLSLSCTPDKFPSIVVQKGATSLEDCFIELHVYGPMTAKTFHSVRIDITKHTARDEILRDVLKEKLDGLAIEVVRS